MKAIQLIAAILFVVLLAAYCGHRATRRDQGGLTERATAALGARGIQSTDMRVVEGGREPAVCGAADGRRFIFRGDPARTANALIVQGDMPPQQFEALVKAWCG